MKKFRRAFPVVLILAGIALYAAWPYFVPDPEIQVNRLITLLDLQPGATAAEVGAGEGRMTVILAQRLGPAGRVYSTELDADKLDHIRKAVAKAGLRNVTVLRAVVKATNLPEQCCDAIFLRRVYHHLTDPDAVNADLFQAVRPGGKLAIIDFPPRRLFRHGAPPAAVIDAVTRAGFVFERRLDDWPGRDYCLVFQRTVIR